MDEWDLDESMGNSERDTERAQSHVKKEVGRTGDIWLR